MYNKIMKQRKRQNKTIKISHEAYKKLIQVKKETKVPIVHQIDNLILEK